jgi:hypothetical protein
MAVTSSAGGKASLPFLVAQEVKTKNKPMAKNFKYFMVFGLVQFKSKMMLTSFL